MNKNQILRLLLGSVFLIAGLCLPFAARFLSADWNPQLGPLQNARESHITLAPDTRKPRFRAVKKGEENPKAYLVQFEETQLFMEFDPAMEISEIQNAVQAHFPHVHIPAGDPDSGRIRYEGWIGHPAKSEPFGWVFAPALVLLAAGGLLVRSATAKSGRR